MNPKNLFQQEPVAIVNAVRLVCLAGMAFGFSLTPVQLVAAMAALESVLTLFTRASVHSQASVDAQLGAVAKANASSGANAAMMGILLAASLGAGVLVSSCAPTTWKPATQAAFNKDSLVKSLGALQHSAIAFAENTPPVIPLEDAKLVVDAVQTILDAADAAGSGLPGTVRAVVDSLTVGQPAAGIPPKLRNATIITLQPFLEPVRTELAKWGE